MRIKKDKQFKELLSLCVELVSFGEDLKDSINKYGKYSKHGKSLHMNIAVNNWDLFIDKNFTDTRGMFKNDTSGI